MSPLDPREAKMARATEAYAGRRLRSAKLSRSEALAVEIALDELTAYIDVVGDEGSLDDEEMPTGKLRWAARQLRALLERQT